MSSIQVSELKSYLEMLEQDGRGDYEVIMNIHHKYDIPKEDGIKGWIAYINAICENTENREVRLIN